MKRIIIKQHTTQLYVASQCRNVSYTLLQFSQTQKSLRELVKMKLSPGLSFFGFILLL